MEKEDQELARVAMLAGEILLMSGAEIFRVEETIQYILKSFGKEAEALVFSTGIFVSMKETGQKPDTIVRRIKERFTNLNRIYMVNMVSRQLCNQELTIEEARIRLEEIEKLNHYSARGKELSYVSAALFFCVLLGGSLTECVGAGIVGGISGIVVSYSNRLCFNSFYTNGLGAFSAGFTALVISSFLLPHINGDLMIISGIMSLVPGVTFTTAVRDTLNGDYSSGVARMVEAVVTALSIAVGVGASIALFARFL